MAKSGFEVAGAEGGRVALTSRLLESLSSAIQGKVLRAGDAGWDEAITIWNAMAAKTPALVVQPVTSEDVATAVAFARDHGLLLSIKGGGHNIAGTALADGGLTLDMSRMRDVEVDVEARRVTAGPGCLLKHVDEATQKYGLATVLGFVSETGMAGLTLGGGFGYLARRFGWAVDNLLEVEIVTADGEVRRASRDEHEDLFWAVRGAGHNMGVVTAFVFRLHEVGPKIVGGLMAFPAETREQARAAVGAYRELTTDAPRELTVFCLLRKAPPAPFVPQEWQGRRIAGFLVCHSGDTATAKEDLTPLTEALGEPVVDIVGSRPYTEQQALIDETEPKGMHYYWKTAWADRLEDGLLDVMADLSLENPMPMGMIGFLHLGGALNERDDDDGAVGNRDVRYGLGALGMWEPGDDEEETYRTWIRGAWEAFEPFSTGRTYVNFLGHDDGTEQTAETFGKNLQRLQQVKATYDPDNLFRVNRNIAPAREPATETTR